MFAQATAVRERINGVRVAALLESVATVRERAALGRCRFRVRNQWLDGGHTRTLVKEFYVADREHIMRNRPLVVECDIPSLIGGTDRAMDPLECLLAALASSITTSIVWHASRRRVHVDAIDTRAEGDIDLSGCLGIDPDVRPGFTEIRLTVTLDAEASAHELDALIDLAKQYSPLVDTIGCGTRVTWTHNLVTSP